MKVFIHLSCVTVINLHKLINSFLFAQQLYKFSNGITSKYFLCFHMLNNTVREHRSFANSFKFKACLIVFMA